MKSYIYRILLGQILKQSRYLYTDQSKGDLLHQGFDSSVAIRLNQEIHICCMSVIHLEDLSERDPSCERAATHSNRRTCTHHHTSRWIYIYIYIHILYIFIDIFKMQRDHMFMLFGMPQAPETKSETSDSSDDDMNALKILDPQNYLIRITTINEPHRP